MADIIAAVDDTAVTTLLHDAEAQIGTLTQSGSGSFGPFSASYSVSVTFSGGTASLNPPNIDINNVSLNYSVNLSFSLALNDFLPHGCLPQICLFGVCTPQICVNWPTITIPFAFSDTVTFSTDFGVGVSSTATNWIVDIVIVSVPLLQFGAVTAAILGALGLALGAALVGIPFIGPFLAGVVVAIVAAIGIAGLTGLLGLIVTPFVSGLKFNLSPIPKTFTLLQAGGAADPAVSVTVTQLSATVESVPPAPINPTPKNELVIEATIAA
jgi:hypothetical protein